MSSNWALPTESSLYTDVLDFIDVRLDDGARMFPSSDTYENLPNGTISFRSNKWQKWNGASWIDLLNHSLQEFYDIGIMGTASNIRGVAAAVNGGTGKSSYTVGDILYASATNAISTLAATTFGSVLITNGANTAPSWGKVNLQDHTVGTLLPAKGGTGVTTISGIIKGNGTNAFSAAVANVDYSPAHDHPYLSLSGGTLTGALSTNSNITTAAAVYASNGFRTHGATGWYSETYGGGMNMMDTTWVRVYGSKALLVENQIAATGNITAYYSDMRLKTKIRKIESALDKLCSLEGFVYINNNVAESFGYTSKEEQLALSAQDVQREFPQLVSLAPFDMKTDETSGDITSKSGQNYLTVDYIKLIPVLVEAIKELKEIVENAR